MANIFGLDHDGGALCLAVMEKKLRGQPENLRLIRRSAGEEEPLALGLELLESAGYDPDEDYLALLYPASRLTWRRVTLPLVNERQIREALPYEIESLTPFDADAAILAWQVEQKNENETTVMVAVTLRADLEAMITTLHSAGIFPDALYPSPAALATAVTEGLCLDINTEETVLVSASKGQVTGFHAIETGVGANLSPEKIAATIVNETGDFGPTDNQEKRLTISGEGSLHSRVVQALADAFGQELSLYTPPGYLGGSINDDSNEDENRSSSLFAAAYGAAALLADSKTPAPLNLLLGPYAKRRRFTVGIQAMISAALAATLVLTALFSYGLEIRGLLERHDELKAEIRQAFKTALPLETTIVAEKQQLEAALEQLRSSRITAGAGLFLDRFADLSTAPPGSLDYQVERLIYEGEGVTITGKTESFEKVEQIKKSYAALPWVGKVTVRNAKTSATGGGVGFTLKVEAN